jgi:hypothetical protein
MNAIMERWVGSAHREISLVRGHGAIGWGVQAVKCWASADASTSALTMWVWPGNVR